MIDTSLCTNYAWKKRMSHGLRFLEQVMGSLAAMNKLHDASGGQLFLAAVSPTAKLYVTSDLYNAGDVSMCLNVMLNRQDYRLTIAYSGEDVVRVEKIDARLARAQTRLEQEKLRDKIEAAEAFTARADQAADRAYDYAPTQPPVPGRAENA